MAENGLKDNLPPQGRDALFRQTFELAPSAMAVIDDAGVLLECNDAFCRLLAYPPTQLRRQPWSAVRPADENPDWQAELRKLTHDLGSLLHRRTRYRAADGHVVEVEQTLSLLPSAGDGSGRCLITLEPVAAAPSHSSRFLRRVLDNLYAFVGVMTPDGTLLEANHAPLAAAGIHADQVIGRKFWDCHWWNYAPEVQQRMCSAVRDAAQGAMVRYDEWIRVKGDERMLIDFQLAPLRDEEGRITHLIPSGIDLTARHAVETALRESEGRFRAITDALPLLVWLHDAQGRQEFVNTTFCEFFGVTREQMRDDAWTALTHPDDGDEYAREFMRCVNERTAFHGQVRVRDAHGNWRWLESWARPRLGPGGEYLGHIGTSADITERKRAEGELREADRRKDHFLATLAHELRNPLAPLRTGLAVLERSGEQAELATETRRMMTRQVDQLVRLIDDLLDISRISQGRIELRMERLEIASVIQSALETCRPQLESRRLELGLPAAPLHVEGDAVRLAQVIGNVLNNACKFTDPGGHIRVSVQPEADMVRISVQDDGVGIPPDRLDAAFAMFAQVGLDPARERMGLGIGLALSRQLVEMHGGTVHALSQGPGSGTEVVIRLPCAHGAESDHSPATQATAEPPPCRVLVVDDNRDAADLLATLLRLSNVQTWVAYSGAQAIEQCASFHPTVVLLDLGMPGMDGYATCRAIRSAAGHSVHIVALTGWGQESDRRRSAAAGFDAHLVKPVEPATLIAAINSLGRTRAG